MYKLVRSQLILALAVTAMLMGCGSSNPPPATSPTVNLSATGKAAYQATKVVKALDVLRDIAIDAEAQSPKLMSTESTRKVVRYHAATVKTIGAVPTGWKSVADEGLTQLQKEIPAAEWAQIEPFVRLVRVLFQEVIQ
jgi:hypothetical protein